jgi:hypothetical protein
MIHAPDAAKEEREREREKEVIHHARIRPLALSPSVLGLYYKKFTAVI